MPMIFNKVKIQFGNTFEIYEIFETNNKFGYLHFYPLFRLSVYSCFYLYIDKHLKESLIY